MQPRHQPADHLAVRWHPAGVAGALRGDLSGRGIGCLVVQVGGQQVSRIQTTRPELRQWGCTGIAAAAAAGTSSSCAEQCMLPSTAPASESAPPQCVACELVGCSWSQARPPTRDAFAMFYRVCDELLGHCTHIHLNRDTFGDLLNLRRFGKFSHVLSTQRNSAACEPMAPLCGGRMALLTFHLYFAFYHDHGPLCQPVPPPLLDLCFCVCDRQSFQRPGAACDEPCKTAFCG